MSYVYKRFYQGKVQAVIFDWAGTTMDYGCLSPAAPFIQTFKDKGIDVTIDEARIPMGMFKRDHIKEILCMTRIKNQWIAKYKTEPTETDIDQLFKSYLPIQLKVLPDFAKLIPGVKETVDTLKKMGIKIGSTTGYAREMIDVLLPLVQKQGYFPENVVCVDEVPKGRPSPWMALTSAMKLGVYPMESIVKVGDTVVDIEEGLNASMWTIGLIKCGNEMGLSEEELNKLSKNENEFKARLNKAYNTLTKAGAHYVVDSTSDIIPVIEEINLRLSRGERP